MGKFQNAQKKNLQSSKKNPKGTALLYSGGKNGEIRKNSEKRGKVRKPSKKNILKG